MGIYAAVAEAIRPYAGLSPAPALFTVLALVVGAYLLVSSFFLRPGAGAEKRVASQEEPKESPPPPIDTAEPQRGGSISMEELGAQDGVEAEERSVAAEPLHGGGITFEVEEPSAQDGAEAEERSITLEEPPLPILSPIVAVEPIQVGDIALEELKGYDGSDPKKPLLMVIKGQVYDVSQGRAYYGPGGEYALFAGRDATRALALMSFDPDDLNGDLDGLNPDELEVLQDWEEKFKEKYVHVGRLVSKNVKDEESDRNKDQLEITPVSHQEGENTNKNVGPNGEESEAGNN
ncbi:membrane steroid-binding protein 2-like isoform X1 [Ananas comosus]|uniref:Membrane steroid-binding protein 2-like isoform X1 n=1 Tax=Ananas comosus TaxID=4615 RepID=A0A6P5GQK1_ANACO|nr:membrane steroid-binding protein 2-like isoform X1 [Ananas comosus]